MYIDKDKQSNFSIMELTREDIAELASILREFEYLIHKSDSVNDKTKGRMTMFSAKLRFQIIDILK